MKLEEKITIFLGLLVASTATAGYFWGVQKAEQFKWVADFLYTLANGSWGALLVALGIKAGQNGN